MSQIMSFLSSGLALIFKKSPKKKFVLHWGLVKYNTYDGYRAVVTHRQGRHLPRATDFKGPPNSLICLKNCFDLVQKVKISCN